MNPRRFGPVAVGAGLAVAWVVAFPPWPDGWDGFGFLASIAKFDMASFAPHAPGYPVYVACLKAAAVVASSPLGAARLVACVSGLVTFAALCVALPSPGSGSSVPTMARPLFAAAVCATPLAFHAFSSVGSEGPALACASLALAGLAARGPALSPRARALLVGLGVGLGLGVRLSWAPFYLPFLFLLPVARLRAWLVALFACLAWGVPLLVVTGTSHLVALYRAQVSGHFERWGGTALTEPVRGRFLARDVLADGFGAGTDLLGLAILVALAVATVAAFVVWRKGTLREDRVKQAWASAFVVAPYVAWVAVGQNLREHPRHVLPIVFVVAFALASAALEASRPLRPLFAALALLVVTRASLDAVGRKTTPPAGAQLLAYVRAHAPLATTALFAGASGRFLDGTEWQAHTHGAGSLGDALLGVTHLDAIPDPLFVTNELTALDESPIPLKDVATFCRPPRIDRTTPCLHLYVLDAKAALLR